MIIMLYITWPSVEKGYNIIRDIKIHDTIYDTGFIIFI